VIAAVRVFYERHGRLPVEAEWEKAQPGRPAGMTMRRCLACYRLLVDSLEIALDRVPVEQRARITNERVRQEIADWYRLSGRLPTADEWDRGCAGPPTDQRSALRPSTDISQHPAALGGLAPPPRRGRGHSGERGSKVSPKAPDHNAQWTDEQELDLLIDARRQLTHWPSISKWHELGRRPGQSGYHKWSGSWSREMRDAILLLRSDSLGSARLRYRIGRRRLASRPGCPTRVGWDPYASRRSQSRLIRLATWVGS